MNKLEQTWRHLAKASHNAQSPAGTEAPFGFSQRVVTRWLSEAPEAMADVWLRVAGRVMLGAAAVMIATVAVYYPVLNRAWEVLDVAGPVANLIVDL
jgi:hypothetical protein